MFKDLRASQARMPERYLKFRVRVNSKKILCICKLVLCKMRVVTEKLVVKMLSSYAPDLILLEPHPL